MDTELKICTYNCCSLRKNVDLIRGLCEDSIDIIFLQETFLLEERLGDLSYVSEMYDGVGISASYSEKALTANAGRAEGGLACLWKRNDKITIKEVMLEKKFIGVQLLAGNHSILLVNVYLKSDLWEARTLSDYLEYLSELENLITRTRFDAVYIMGDFNADPYTGRAWSNLGDFSSRNNLKCFDFETLDSSTFTFISYGNTHCKWLDHVVGRDSDNVSVSSVRVLYEVIGSDHLPLETVLTIKNDTPFSAGELEPNDGASVQYYVDWNNLSMEDIQMIEERALDIMGNFLNCVPLRCTKPGCRHGDHIREIDRLLDLLIESVRSASEIVQKEHRRKNKYNIIPGWNRNVKHLHTIARRDYLDWVSLGRSRESEVYTKMNVSRGNFKSALNDCKVNELRERSISVEQNYRNKNMKNFWKDVHTMNNKIKHSNLIDGHTSDDDILRIFNSKFFENNESSDVSNEEDILVNKLRRKWPLGYKMNLTISTQTLKGFIKRLSNGIGHDGIHDSFLKRASDSFLNCISALINTCYMHCYIPSETLKGDLNPTIKDQKGNCTESSNYRPVMQSSCLLKIMEMHILQTIEEKVSFNSRQFGFKKGTSTTDACYLLKEVVHRYTKGKGRAYSVFIDLSKAFDKVDHFILGNTLLNKNVPVDLVFLIMHYLRNQTARVVWNGTAGQYHVINEGVRQGGILSPFLFKLYIDHVISDLSTMEIGCRLGLVRMNVIAYADDIVLISNTKENLEKLYISFVDHIKYLKLKMNTTKSKCMVFENSRFGIDLPEIKLGEDTLQHVTEYKYLGHVIQRNLDDGKDVDVKLKQFYGKFNTTFRNFRNVSIETFIHLFCAYCMPDYGLPLWNSLEVFRKHIFSVFRVAYNNALKRVVGVPNVYSSHDIVDYCRLFLLNHFIIIVQCRFFKRVMRVNNPLIKLSRSFLMRGYHLPVLCTTLKDRYSVDFNFNELDVLIARIAWIQRNEERTGVRFLI